MNQLVIVRPSGMCGWLLASALLLGLGSARSWGAAAGKIDYTRDIRPILSDNCFACHGPDETKREAGLRLDLKEAAFKELDSGGFAIVKGNLTKSEIIKVITAKDPDDIMPPTKTGKKLTPAQIELIKKWISQGADWQEHWSFVKPQRPELPVVKDKKWGRNEVDAFILARLEKQGLKPSAEADRTTLIRRVTFDLTGLPPTPAEVDTFLADNSPDAYERMVDRLLQSPRFGEQMGRHWLDVARYGDTHGLHLDNERSMWPYRDWVVKAFNRNVPFDQFTIEQLAGDLLPNATQDQQVASGFNRCNVTTSEGGSIADEYVFRYAVDRTSTTAAVWMGLTAGCAVCHDHKFDPISAKDFYSMYAFFNSTADPAMDGNILLTPPILKLATPDQQKKLDDFSKQLTDLDARIKATATKFEYTDPSTLNPPPPKRTDEQVWVDDGFPEGAKAESTAEAPATTWVTEKDKDGKVFSGKLALKRTAKGIAQDFFSGLPKPWEVMAGSKIYLHVYLDPTNPPKAVMMQFNTGTWSHRAVWGDIDAIDFGKKDTNERKLMGPLPKTGEWVRLELDAKKQGLTPEMKISGLAFTQKDGTVYYDKAGLTTEIDPAKHSSESLAAWEKEHQGKANKSLPGDVEKILKDVKPEDRKDDQKQRLREYYIQSVYAGARKTFEPLNADRQKIQKERDAFDTAIPATLIMRDLEKPREAFVMVRGQYNKPGARVYPNVPSILPPLPAGQATNRLALAKWLVSPEHPLTARVTVNRFWQQFFGTGIVKTSGDFGSQGEPPTHPELLDRLATTFQKGWDMKALVREIVTSATYRQSSAVTKKLLEVDPGNRLLARGPRFRLEAEEIRDNALYVSGLLNPTIGGKGVRPYQPENIWEPVAYSGSNTREYKRDNGDSLYRRSLYTFWKRTAPPPTMTTFDAPSREEFCVRRERSNTPLQALILMNDVQHFEAARALGQRMMTEGGTTIEDRLVYGFRVVLARQPTKAEIAVLKQSFQQQWVKYLADVEAAKKTIAYGESKPRADLNPSELAAYALTASLLLNLDETVTKN